MADTRGYSYDRRDVTARWLANAYAQTLGAIFSDTSKPFEVEICIAEVNDSPATDELYRITYDGSVGDEHGYMVMGGNADAISNVLKEEHQETVGLAEALALAVKALGSVGGENGAPRQIADRQLEVAVLDRRRKGRAFRRIAGSSLNELLAGSADVADADLGEVDAAPPGPAEDKPTVSAASVDTEGEARAASDDPAEPADDVNGDGS